MLKDIVRYVNTEMDIRSEYPKMREYLEWLVEKKGSHNEDDSFYFSKIVEISLRHENINFIVTISSSEDLKKRKMVIPLELAKMKNQNLWIGIRTVKPPVALESIIIRSAHLVNYSERQTGMDGVSFEDAKNTVERLREVVGLLKEQHPVF